jgi:hypothetical protein
VSQIRQLSGSFTVEVSLDRLADELADRVAERVAKRIAELLGLSGLFDHTEPAADEALRGAEPDLPLTGGAHTSWPVGHHEAAEEPPS